MEIISLSGWNLLSYYIRRQNVEHNKHIYDSIRISLKQNAIVKSIIILKTIENMGWWH